MQKRLIVANVILAVLAVFFVVHLVRDLSRSSTLPLPPPPRPIQTPAAAPAGAAGAGETLASYNVIPARSLFSPTRGEGPASSAPAGPPPPKPVLLGVVVDEPRSLAYLEDPATKRILAYRVGDTVAGGRLERIADDRIVIRRADGQVDVLLNDPTKHPVAPVPGPAGAAPGTPAPGPTRPPIPARMPPPMPPAGQPSTPQQ